MITVTEFAVHKDDESPIFGENAVKVKLMDAGSGYFISMQDMICDDTNEVRLDFTQLNEIVEQIKLLGWK